MNLTQNPRSREHLKTATAYLGKYADCYNQVSLTIYEILLRLELGENKEFSCC